jgi:serine/threonine protein kinase
MAKTTVKLDDADTHVFQVIFERLSDGRLPSPSQVEAEHPRLTTQLRNPARMQELLSSLPFEDRTFRDRYPTLERVQVIKGLHRWCTLHRQAKSATTNDELLSVEGSLGLLLLILTGLQESESPKSRLTGLPESDSHSCDAICKNIVSDPEVRRAIKIIYAPQDGALDIQSRWTAINFNKLQFLKHGTTSVLLKTENDEGSIRVLKLVLLPFLRIPEIAEATRRYKATYGLIGTASSQYDTSHLVAVHASYDSWILMDYVPGETLAELFAKRATISPEVMRDTLDIDWMKKIGLGLLDALELNHGASQEAKARGLTRPEAHGDLSPSNIIIPRGSGGTSCVLVDFGPNYLFTATVAGGNERQSTYLAPEVRMDAPDLTTQLPDLYSLAQIMIAATGLVPNDDGTVPDAIYMWHPMLARFFEDYLDQDPHHRLALSRGTAVINFSQLRAQLEFESDVAIRAKSDTSDWYRRLPRWILELRPLSGEPGRQRSLLSAINNWEPDKQYGTTDPSAMDTYIGEQRRRTRLLMRCSYVAAIISTYTAITVFWWLLRDKGLSWGNTYVTIIQALFGGTIDDSFPGIDSLRSVAYVVPDLAHNWPGRVVCLSYALLAAKIYQSIFARMFPISIGRNVEGLGVLPILLQGWMWFMPIFNTALILWITLIDIDAWPIAVIVGQTVIFFGNMICAVFTDRAIKVARQAKVSTVPDHSIPITGLDLLTSWVSGSLFYAVVVWVVGLLIMSGALLDVGFYASMTAAVNIGLLYISRCGLNSPKIRVAMHRAIFAGERLKIHSET